MFAVLDSHLKVHKFLLKTSQHPTLPGAHKSTRSAEDVMHSTAGNISHPAEREFGPFRWQRIAQRVRNSPTLQSGSDDGWYRECPPQSNNRAATSVQCVRLSSGHMFFNGICLPNDFIQRRTHPLCPRGRKFYSGPLIGKQQPAMSGQHGAESEAGKQLRVDGPKRTFPS